MGSSSSLLPSFWVPTTLSHSYSTPIGNSIFLPFDSNLTPNFILIFIIFLLGTLGFLPQVLCLLEHVNTHPPHPLLSLSSSLQAFPLWVFHDIHPLPCTPMSYPNHVVFILFLASLVLQYSSCSSHLCFLSSY